MKSAATIKIIGFGKVIQDFLKTTSVKSYSEKIEIYCNSNIPDIAKFPENVSVRNIKEFQATDDLVVVAVSTNEELLLKKENGRARELVAAENLKIVQGLCDKNLFSKGIIFVLTNPVELIAEFIRQKSNNTNIYGLGYTNDLIRMKKITGYQHSDTRSIKLLGYHYLNPILSIRHRNCSLSFSEIQTAERAYERLVQNEFHGFRPPVKSGSRNLQDFLLGIQNQKPLMVSGYCKKYESFLFGDIQLGKTKFKINMPSSKAEFNYLKQKVNAHKTFCKKLGVI